MRVNPKLRVALLIGAFALTLGAVYWADKLTDMTEASAGAVAEAVPRAKTESKPAATMQKAPPLDLNKLRRGPLAEPDGEAFGPRSFKPPPPKVAPTPVVVAAAPPPPPQAPPLPFSYIGRLAEDRNTTVFLTQGERNIIAKPGDVIDNTYKVEEVNDTTVVLTYLPLSQRQTLSTGAQ